MGLFVARYIASHVWRIGKINLLANRKDASIYFANKIYYPTSRLQIPTPLPCPPLPSPLPSRRPYTNKDYGCLPDYCDLKLAILIFIKLIRMRKVEKRTETDKNANYKNLISQYYDRDPHLGDIKGQIRSITPEVDVLDELNEFEKKIDGLIKTKRYDVQEMYMKPAQKLRRLLRMKVTREFLQGQQTIKLYGYIHPKKEETASTKFTSFFRQITVVNEKDKSTIETWKKPVTAFQEKDGVVLKLAINPEDPISIYLSLITNPQKFEVDPLLQKIVGMRVGTRIEVLDAFWLYIKTKKLQDIQNKEIINSDDLIRQAFKTEKLTFATINSRVRELLIPVEPIKITLSPTDADKIYDISVEIQQRPNIDIVPFFSLKLNEERNDHPFLSLIGKIKKYENKFRDHTEKLRRHLCKRELYKNFSSEKIEEIIAEQHRLLKELNLPDPIEDYNRLEYILQNEDELQREIKHYFENLGSGLSRND